MVRIRKKSSWFILSLKFLDLTLKIQFTELLEGITQMHLPFLSGSRWSSSAVGSPGPAGPRVCTRERDWKFHVLTFLHCREVF